MSDESERAIGYLSGSPARVTILEGLTEGAVQPADLVEFADVSRTTVHRTLTELTDRCWVQRVDGGYVATTAGTLALETYKDVRARFRTLERLEPFFAHVDADVTDLEIEWLRTAELVTATEANPHRPLEWYADRFGSLDGERLRGVSPTISRQLIGVHTPMISRGLPTKLVISDSTFQVIADRYPDEIRAAASQDHYDLYVADDTPTMGIMLFGETVFLGAFDGGGQLVAIVGSSDSRLREWAAARYRRWRADARLVSGEPVSPSR